MGAAEWDSVRRVCERDPFARKELNSPWDVPWPCLKTHGLDGLDGSWTAPRSFRKLAPRPMAHKYTEKNREVDI